MKHKALQINYLEQELYRALAEDELEIHYQPIVDLDSGAAAGAEALRRWRYPTRGLLTPGEFIALAEASDVIVPLGEWVLRAVSHPAMACCRRSCG